MPIVTTHIENKQKKSLKDPIIKYSTNEDHVFMQEKFYIKNCVKISRLIMKSLFITFVLGIIWFIFSATTHMFIFEEKHDEFDLEQDRHGQNT